jgi:hypothetical protein
MLLWALCFFKKKLEKIFLKIFLFLFLKNATEKEKFVFFFFPYNF